MDLHREDCNKSQLAKRSKMSHSLAEQIIRPRNLRRAMGKRLRKETPRSSHGDWQPAADRPDPLKILQAQDKGRIQELLPIKYGRMAASPFAFLRGSAAVMAADLVGTPASGQLVVLCGDAHISNFGLFASPERTLVFDINDFDECYPGPWEWDLKRLAASVIVAGRENGYDDETNRKLAALTAEVYRRTMRQFAKQSTMDTWYFHIKAKDVQKLFEWKASKRDQKETAKTINKAMGKTQARTLGRMTHMEDGRRRINHEPPLLVPLRFIDFESRLAGIFTAEEIKQVGEQDLRQSWQEYLDSLPEERRYLLERFRVIDIALRVGGVGSVGTRCHIFLLEGGGKNEGLILQLKEAGPSVLQAHLQTQTYEENARRVVLGQRLMQATSDPFLGWHRSPISGHNYYWRQLKDMKGSIDVANLDVTGYGTYIGICAASLARAHARTGDPAAIAGYLGKSDVFDRAIANFAANYADQTEKDHAALKQAIADGRIKAQEGI
jgi:uncharacterized protein (DUF2252 family)